MRSSKLLPYFSTVSQYHVPCFNLTFIPNALISGALVPVSLGRMRNQWFPQRMADYLTRSELEFVKKKRGLESIVRDFEFGKNWDKEDVKTEIVPGEDSDPQQPTRKISTIEKLQLSVSAS